MDLPARKNELSYDTIKRLYADKCSDEEFKVFISVCQRTGLRPESRQICAIKMGGKMVTMVTIDGLRLIAQRSGEYFGQDGPYWCGSDGIWRDVWISDKNPVACKVGVLRKGFNVPLYAVAHYSEFCSNNPTWNRLGIHMIAKCAESLALRKAFPQELSGIYTKEEFSGVNGIEKEANNNSFLDQMVGFKKCGSSTWRNLAENCVLPDGSSGRSYLHKLSAWKDNDEVSRKATIALDMIPSPNKKKDEEEVVFVNDESPAC